METNNIQRDQVSCLSTNYETRGFLCTIHQLLINLLLSEVILIHYVVGTCFSDHCCFGEGRIRVNVHVWTIAWDKKVLVEERY